MSKHIYKYMYSTFFFPYIELVNTYEDTHTYIYISICTPWRARRESARQAGWSCSSRWARRAGTCVADHSQKPRSHSNKKLVETSASLLVTRND